MHRTIITCFIIITIAHVCASLKSDGDPVSHYGWKSIPVYANETAVISTRNFGSVTFSIDGITIINSTIYVDGVMVDSCTNVVSCEMHIGDFCGSQFYVVEISTYDHLAIVDYKWDKSHACLTLTILSVISVPLFEILIIVAIISFCICYVSYIRDTYYMNKQTYDNSINNTKSDMSDKVVEIKIDTTKKPTQINRKQ